MAAEIARMLLHKYDLTAEQEHGIIKLMGGGSVRPMKTAVIGCGAISDIYLQNMMGKFAGLEVVSCCARHRETAEKKALQYGIRAAAVEEVLQDKEVELVVVLTPAPSHYELIRRALRSGKHVYTEKTLALALWQAQELLALAKEKDLRLGAAPETFLGSALQTARKALDEGLLGQVSSFHVVANRDLTLLASVFQFLRLPGGGISYDYGVYYLTALVSLLGPMAKVYAQMGNLFPVRKNVIPGSQEFGQSYAYNNEAQVNAVLTTKSGVAGTFSLNGDSAIQDQGYFTIHGTKGILRLGDANQFDGEVCFLPNDPREGSWQVLEPVSVLSDNCRGIGPADMALCIREGGEHLASAEMACHVLDILEQMRRSSETGLPAELTTDCQRPRPFDRWQTLMR